MKTRQVETSIVASIALDLPVKLTDEQIADALRDAEFKIRRNVELYVPDGVGGGFYVNAMVDAIRFGAVEPDEVDINAERAPLDFADESYFAPFRN